MIEQAVVLAGGRARRLGSLGLETPKCLQPVNGRPFIAYQLELLASQGIRRVVMLTGYLAGQVEDRLGNGSAYGLSVQYRRDAEPDIGTGGALRDAAPLLDESFVVEYGDTYLRAPIRDVCAAFEAANAPALMTVFENADALEPSNVLMDRGVIRAYGKASRRHGMLHIDYGLSVFHKRALTELPVAGSADLGLVFTSLIARDELAAFQVRDRFYEIGTPATLKETESFLRDHHTAAFANGVRI